MPSLVEIDTMALEKKILKKIVYVFPLFLLLSPLREGQDHFLNITESRSSKDALYMYQVWLKLAQWFMSIYFYMFINFRYFDIILPHRKGRGPLLKILKFPSPKDALCQV